MGAPRGRSVENDSPNCSRSGLYPTLAPFQASPKGSPSVGAAWSSTLFREAPAGEVSGAGSRAEGDPSRGVAEGSGGDTLPRGSGRPSITPGGSVLGERLGEAVGVGAEGFSAAAISGAGALGASRGSVGRKPAGPSGGLSGGLSGGGGPGKGGRLAALKSRREEARLQAEVSLDLLARVACQ